MQNYLATLKLKLCKVCNVWYRENDRPSHEKSSSHLNQLYGYDPIVQIESAAKCRLTTFYIKNVQGHLDYLSFYDYSKQFIIDKIHEKIGECNSLKCNILVKSLYIKDGLEKEKREIVFKTKNEPIFSSTNVESYCNDVFQKLIKEENDYRGKGSGWSLSKIIGLELRINKYSPLRGRQHIALPADIAQKNAIINVQNKDDKCFQYAVYSKFVNRNAHRVSNYLNNEDMENRYNWDVISFPVTVKDIPKFEKANNISINVFGLEKKPNSKEHYVYPIKVCKTEKEDHRDLLLLKDESTTHFAYIKDFERLVCSQITRHHGRIYVCKSCLIHFTSKSVFEKHKVLCNSHTPVKVEMPDESEKNLCFSNFNHKQLVPYVVYADFEALLSTDFQCSVCDQTPCRNTNDCKSKSNTVKQQKHVPMSFAYYVVNTLGIKSDPVIYRGLDAGKVFIEKLKEEAIKVKNLYDSKLPMKDLTLEQINQFNSATKCHICQLDFDDDELRVRDHDPLTGLFRGAAHNGCNLLYQCPRFLPVLMHNLSNYDMHFICQNLTIDDLDITVIPSTEEKYISLSKKVSSKFEIRFLDSFRFMSSSLDSLAKNLCKSQFKETTAHFGTDHIDLVTKKGVFPYEYVSNWEKLSETQLPPIQMFYSSLNESNITMDQYKHAETIWNTFNIQDLGSYSDFYLKTDVLILTDVFQNFREVCKTHYDIDPCWYYSAPGLSWDACLKMTNINLELITDYEMFILIEKGIRGGISVCTKRYSEARNKYLNNESPDLPSNYLIYFDINNLYGWSMSQYIPYKDFKWLNSDEIRVLKSKILETKKSDDVGYILEVDIEYPNEIHEKHSDFPFLPEKKKPPKGKFEKLLNTLENKSNYVCHIQTLKQALKNGLKLLKVHRAISFQQSAWLSKYIGKNTDLRAQAKNSFEQDFFKLMNNSFFGKTMENVRNRLNIKLVGNNTRKLDKLVAKPNFIDRTIFKNDLVAVHLGKTRVKFAKPIYIGLTVLELSKKLMYNYHYKKFPNVFGAENMSLNYMDTDSFIYSITCVDIYDKIKKNLHLFDTSNYPKSHPCYSEERKKQIGYMKDEYGGIPLRKFIGLRSKLYSVMPFDFNCSKRAKGVKKCIVEKEINFDDYEAALFANVNQFRSMNFIRSYRHELYTCNLNKLALSSFDDKRYILGDNVNTLPYGHVALVKDRKRKREMFEELRVKRMKLS
jgi:hypothetical protein